MLSLESIKKVADEESNQRHLAQVKCDPVMGFDPEAAKAAVDQCHADGNLGRVQDNGNKYKNIADGDFNGLPFVALCVWDADGDEAPYCRDARKE
jgi:hypothetical protein